MNKFNNVHFQVFHFILFCSLSSNVQTEAVVYDKDVFFSSLLFVCFGARFTLSFLHCFHLVSDIQNVCLLFRLLQHDATPLESVHRAVSDDICLAILSGSLNQF